MTFDTRGISLRRPLNPPGRFTFFQPQTWMRGWTRADWARELKLAQELGIRWIVLQWAEHDGVSFVGPDANGHDFIADALNEAQRLNMGVVIGTLSESAWFRDYASAAYRQEYFTRLQTQMHQLRLRYGSHPALIGWYSPLEFWDEGMLQSNPELVQELDLFLNKISSEMSLPTEPSQVGPTPFYLSVFFSGRLSVSQTGEAFARFFASQKVPSAHVFVQDGIGTRSWDDPLTMAKPLMEAIAQACKLQNRTTCYGTIEAFQPSGDAFIPSSPDRVVRQLQLAQSIFTNIGFFDWPHYLSPLRGNSQQTLFNGLKTH